MALVTNAGTPGIADPGYTVVRRAIDEASARDHDPRRLGARDGAGALGPARAQLYLSRLYAAQARRRAGAFTRPTRIALHPDLL